MTDATLRGSAVLPVQAARAAPELRRVALFLLVGCAGLAVDAGLFTGASAFGLSRAAARALSLACATGVTWRLNRAFTFSAAGRGDPAEAIRYAAVTLAAQGFSFALFVAASIAAPALPPLAALLAGAGAAAALSFAGQRFFTFRSPERRATQERPHAPRH